MPGTEPHARLGAAASSLARRACTAGRRQGRVPAHNDDSVAPSLLWQPDSASAPAIRAFAALNERLQAF